MESCTVNTFVKCVKLIRSVDNLNMIYKIVLFFDRICHFYVSSLVYLALKKSGSDIFDIISICMANHGPTREVHCRLILFFLPESGKSSLMSMDSSHSSVQQGDVVRRSDLIPKVSNPSSVFFIFLRFSNCHCTFHRASF